MEQIEVILATVTVVLLTAWIISRLAYRHPSTCDLVWRTSLVLVAISPGVIMGRAALVDWQWKFPLWPATTTQSPNGEIVPDAPQEQSTSAGPSRRRGPGPPSTRIPTEYQPMPSDEESSDERSTIPSVTIPAIEASRQAAKPARSWRDVVMSIWFTGTMLHLIAIGLSASNGLRLRRTAQIVTDAACLTLTRQCADSVGLRSIPRLVTSSRIASPVVVGFLRPQIVTPVTLLSEIRRNDLRAVLLHECGHLRRFDLAYDLLLKFVLAAFWPHPLVYVLAREIRRLREEMCDNFVLFQESAVSYAETLLRVAVGKRLNEALLLGIGVFSKTHRLEQRVASILSPQRRVETSAPRRTRVLVSCAVSGCLALGLMVRLTSLAAAPPTSAKTVANTVDRANHGSLPDQPAAVPVTEEEAVKQSFEKALSAANADPVEIAFRLVDTQGKPVAGAKVLPSGVACFSGAFWGGEDAIWRQVESDAEGFVRFPLPIEIVSNAVALNDVTGGLGVASRLIHSMYIPQDFPKNLQKLGIHKLYLRVDHPDHPLWWNYLELGAKPEIELADSCTLIVRTRRTGETELAQRVVPRLAGSHSTDWAEELGVVTYRRVDLSSESVHPSIQMVQFPEQGPAWLSDVVDLKHLAGNSISLDLTLHPTTRVEGRLADDVPRPVKNGTILGKLVHLTGDDQQGNAWSVRTGIAEDGTFALDSLPRNQTLQLIAICDGWNSRSPTQSEMADFKTKHRFPQQATEYAGAGQVFPQLFRVDETAIHNLVVPMVPTASCEITAVDQQNRPVPGVHVQFHPNQVFFHWGSTTLGSGLDDASLLHEQLVTRNHDQKRPQEISHREYSADTDQDGKATIVGLPYAASDAPASRQLASFLALHEKYIAQSPESANMPSIMGASFLSVKLTSKDPTQLTLRMVPRPVSKLNTAPDPLNDAQMAASPETELSGRVEDAEGRPIEGVQVSIGEEDGFKIRTDAQGKYHHRFEAGLFAAGEPNVLPLCFIKVGFATLVREVRFGSGEETIQLRNNTWFEGLVRKPDGTPAANVPVQAFYESRTTGVQEDINVKSETTTDGQGRYRLLVEQGQYRIIAGNSTAGVAWLPPSDVETNSEPPSLPIFSGEHQSLDIQLAPGVQLVAQFLDQVSGQPIPKARLFAHTHADRSEQVGKADDSGTVIYPALPSGKLHFQIYASKYLRCRVQEFTGKHQDDSSSFLPTDAGLTFDLRPGMSPVKILCEPGVEVTGIVRDPQGTAMPRVEVYLASNTSNAGLKREKRYSHMTNGEGRFRFLLPTSGTQSYRLVANPQWRRKAESKWSSGISNPFIVAAEKPVLDLEIRLTEPGTIRGRVVDHQGKPVASAFVQATAVDQREEPNSNPSTTSRRDGSFELRHVRPGRHWLHGKIAPTDADSGLRLPQVEVQPHETTQAGDVVIPVPESTDTE